MFFGFNLNEILTFPFKDQESRKHFLVGALVSISAFIIPILPFFVLTGYAVQIAKQVMRGENPRMVAWDDWGKLFSDGAKVFGIRFILTSPILIFAIPLMFVGLLIPVFMANASPEEMETFMAIYSIFITASVCIIFPVSIALAVILPLPRCTWSTQASSPQGSEFVNGGRSCVPTLAASSPRLSSTT